jgi:hypothetical protein
MMKPKRIWLGLGLVFFLLVIGLGFYYYHSNQSVSIPMLVQKELRHLLNKNKPRNISEIILKNGDYVKPKFSPDGILLAYSKVVLAKVHGQNTEYTEVLITDLSTGKVQKLLNAEDSKKYAVYKAFISDISWKNNRECVITVSDGDVGASVLSIDANTQKVTHSDYIEVYERWPYRTGAQKATRDQIVASFPEWDQNYLNDSIMQYSFLIPGRGIVIQKNYSGEDQNVWLLDFQNKQIKALLEVDEGCLRNGFAFKDSMVFLVGTNHEATIYQARNDEAAVFDTLRTKIQYGYLDIKYQSAKQVIFRAIVNHTYEQGDNPLYLDDGKQIRKISNYKELYDADIDAKGDKIAFCYWEKNQRHIAVKSLTQILLAKITPKIYK